MGAPAKPSTRRPRAAKGAIAGRTLERARLAARLSQRQLAEQVGVDHSYISRIEDGTRPIEDVAYGTVVRLARVLKAPTVTAMFPVEASV